MATETKLIASNGYYGNSGNSSFSNSGKNHLYVGKYGDYRFRSRMTFESLRNKANIGESRIAILSAILYVYKNGGNSVTTSAGCSSSSDWNASLASSGSASHSDSTGWKSIDVTNCGDAIAEYTGNWYMHLRSSASTYIRYTGTGESNKPYLKVTWEYIAATIKGDKSNVSLGDTVTFTITPEVDGETHTLEYFIGDSTGVIATKAGNSIAWVPPASLATEITNDDTGMVEILMTAYDASGNVQRTERYYQTVVVPDTISGSVQNVGSSLKNGLSGYGLTGKSYLSIAPVIDMNNAQGATLSNVTATVNGQEFKWTSFSESEAGIFACSTVNTAIFGTAGTYVVTVVATDSRERTVTATQTYTICEYAPPVIQLFAVERYEPVYDSNEQISGYQASDLGGYVWVNISATCSAIAPNGTQLNALKWSIKATRSSTGTSSTKSGTGMQTINIFEDRNQFTAAVSESEAWNYELTVTDTAGYSVVQYSVVTPARANLSLASSKYGVSFGGIAKGTQEMPMTESHYPIYAYAGIMGEDGYRLDKAVKTETLTLTGSFGVFSTSDENTDFTPRVTRIGSLVFLSGMLTNTATMTIDATERIVATLPDWAKPQTHVNVLQQGSSTHMWWMRVRVDGSLTISRYRNAGSSDYVSQAAGKQFPITACWVAADAYK